MKVLAVTGYKPMEINIFKETDPKIAFIKAAIEKKLIGFIEEGLEWILISGQMGVELWAAEVALDLKEEYDIQIAIIPPFENQENRWPEELKMKYEEVTMVVDFYQPLYTGDYKGPYQFKAKNKWLIEKSDACLILFDDEYPGSNRFFYEEAKNTTKDYPVYLITPSDLDDMVEELRMGDPDYWN
jgi:uncharacterized phage-like protein YoqJ